MINIILADSQQIIREGIKMILGLYEDIHIIGETDTGRDLITLIKKTTPNVVLLDIRIPLISGLEAIRIIKTINKNIKVIILTSYKDDYYVLESIKFGADGYLLKDSSSDSLINAIRAVYEGGMILSPEIAKKLATAYKTISEKSACFTMEKEMKSTTLTSREIDVAKLISRGKTNKDICHILFLSEGTVKNYVSKILSKLNLSSRTELALFVNNYLENSHYVS